MEEAPVNNPRYNMLIKRVEELERRVKEGWASKAEKRLLAFELKEIEMIKNNYKQ